MSDIERMAEVLRQHESWPAGEYRDGQTYKGFRCRCGWFGEDPHVHQAQAAIDTIQLPRAITSLDEIDALPDFAIVGLRMPIQPSDRQNHLFAMEKDGGWFGVGGHDELSMDEIAEAMRGSSAVLLWHPAWVKEQP